MANEWIWVRNKLPEEGKNVFAYCGWNGDIEVAFMKNNKWYLAWDRKTKLLKISHWMPLPENKPNRGEGWLWECE